MMSIALLLPSFHTLSKMVIAEWAIVYGSVEGNILKWGRSSLYLFNCLLYGFLYAFIKVLSTLIGGHGVYTFLSHCLDEHDLSYLTRAWYAMICPLILSLLLTNHVWKFCCQPNPSSLCCYGKATDLYSMGTVSCLYADIDPSVLADCGHLCRLVNTNYPSPPCHWRIF